MAKDTFYFSHDYNTRNDIKIKKLMSKYGFEGYGIFWAIIEELYNNTNVLPTDYDTISFDLRCKKPLLISILNDFDLFVFNGDTFGSLSVQKRLDERDAKSIKARESVGYRWNKPKDDTNVIQTNNDSNTIKERKGKELKEKKVKNTEFIPPSLSEAKAYFKESGYTEASAERFFNYYNISNWVDSKGNKVKNWKQKANAIWFKDENKQVEIPEGDRMCEFVSKGNFYNKPVQMKYSIYLFHKSNDQFEGDTKLIKML